MNRLLETDKLKLNRKASLGTLIQKFLTLGLTLG